MQVIASGNAIVDAIGKMNFTGNIIPETWYSKLKYKNGKPHMNAIIILSDIVYWYRPREYRSEYDGTLIYKKKFANDDYLQRNYKQLSKKFGISEGQAKAAIVFLEKDIGVIIRHFKQITTGYGTVLYNVMFLELIPQKLEEITYPILKDGGVVIKQHTPNNEIAQEDISKDTHVLLKHHTYTKNITEINNKDYNQSFNQSMIDRTNDMSIVKNKEESIASIEELKETYSYDKMRSILTYRNFIEECKKYKLNQLEIKNRANEELKFLISYDTFKDKEEEIILVNCLLDYMSDIITTQRSVVLNGTEYDGGFLANKFFDLDCFVIQYVISKFNEISKEIKIINKKNYLIRMLITARSDMESDTQGSVNYDLAHLY